MTPTTIHHARIMIEGGCTIEDVCVTLGLKFTDAVYAVAGSLKANPEENRKVRKILTGMKMPVPPPISTAFKPRITDVHKGRRAVESVESLPLKTRIAA